MPPCMESARTEGSAPPAVARPTRDSRARVLEPPNPLSSGLTTTKFTKSTKEGAVAFRLADFVPFVPSWCDAVHGRVWGGWTGRGRVPAIRIPLLLVDDELVLGKFKPPALNWNCV